MLTLYVLSYSNGLPKVVAPRMYCDICEEFDLHETDDCPKQAGEMEEESKNTKHHGTRNADRPFCDNCEGITPSPKNRGAQAFLTNPPPPNPTLSLLCPEH